MPFDAYAGYKGDLNGDGRVDLADMVFLAKAIKAGNTDSSLDVNTSGNVDDQDLHRLADIIISGSLTDDSGLNVGIGGWDDSGEDFGGTVKVPSHSTRSAADIHFYMQDPAYEREGLYSMEFGIEYGAEDLASAIFITVGLPADLLFDETKIVELEQNIKDTHSIYGNPKYVEVDDDSWSGRMLRFIIFSPDLAPLPITYGKLGRVFYFVDEEERWGSPYFYNCQIILAENDECVQIPAHSGNFYGNIIPASVDAVMDSDEPCDVYSMTGKLLMKGVAISEIGSLDSGVFIIRQSGKTIKLIK